MALFQKHKSDSGNLSLPNKCRMSVYTHRMQPTCPSLTANLSAHPTQPH